PYIGYALFSIFCGSQLLKHREEKYILRNCILFSINIFQALSWTTYYLLKFTPIDRNGYWNLLFLILYVIVSMFIYHKLKVYLLGSEPE
ncbi:MAG: hypothetical protein ACRCWR_00330, partial [Saezia sp.]